MSLGRPAAHGDALLTHGSSGDEKLAQLMASCENTRTNIAVSEALFALGTHVSRSHGSSDLALVNSTALLPQLNSLVLKLLQRLVVYDENAHVVMKPIQLCKSLLGIVRLASYESGRHFDAIYGPEARSHTLQLLQSSSSVRLTSSMNGQGVSNLLWALGSLGFKGKALPPSLMEDIFQRTLGVSAEMTDHTVSSILVGLQRLGYLWSEVPLPLQSCLSSAICRLCLKLSPQAVGNILYSLGKLGASQMVLTDRVNVALELGVRRAAPAMVRRDVMQAVQGLALMRYSWSALAPATQEAVATAIYNQASRHWASPPRGPPPPPGGYSAEIGTTVYSLAQLGVSWAAAPSALRAGVLVAFTALSKAGHQAETSRALAASLYGLAKMGASFAPLPSEVRRAVALCMLRLPLNPQETVMVVKALGSLRAGWLADLPPPVQRSVYSHFSRALDRYDEGGSGSDRLSYQGFSVVLYGLGQMGLALQEMPAGLRERVEDRCLQCLVGADAERLSSVLHVRLSLRAQWDDFNIAAKSAVTLALQQALGSAESDAAALSSALNSLAEMKADLSAAPAAADAVVRYIKKELPSMPPKHLLNWMRATALVVGPKEQLQWGAMQEALLQAVLRTGEELAADPVSCAVALSTLSSIDVARSGAARDVVIQLFDSLLRRAAPDMEARQLTVAMYALCSFGHTASAMSDQLLESLLQSSRRLLLSDAGGEEEVSALLRALSAVGVLWPQLRAGAASDKLAILPATLSAAASLDLYSSLIKMHCFDSRDDEPVVEQLFIDKLFRDEEGEVSAASRALSGENARLLLRTLETLVRAGLRVEAMRQDARQLFLLRSCQGLVEAPPAAADYMLRLLRALSRLGVRWEQLPPTGQYIVLAYSAKSLDIAAAEAASQRLQHRPFHLLAALAALGCDWAHMQRTSPEVATRLLHSACEDFLCLRRVDTGRMVEDCRRLTETMVALGLRFDTLDAASKRLLVGSLTRVCTSYVARQGAGGAPPEMLEVLQLLPLLQAGWPSLPTRPRNALSTALGDVLHGGDAAAAEQVLRALAASGGRSRLFTKNLREALARTRTARLTAATENRI